MTWEEIIEKDKISSVSTNFTENVLARTLKGGSRESRLKKRHLVISVAAGVVIGFIMLNLYHNHHAFHDRQTSLKEWIGQYHFDDTNLEKLDKDLF